MMFSMLVNDGGGRDGDWTLGRQAGRQAAGPVGIETK